MATMILLSLFFFVTAFLYACVGFGGGSTYNALLILAGTDYKIIPVVSLLCNIIVVSGGVWHFSREGHIRIQRILPWIAFSIPASFAGGLIPVSEVFFIGLLGFILLCSGIGLLWPERDQNISIRSSDRTSNNKLLEPLLGTFLGILAGITGIGGGIFLAPILHFLRWGSANQIAGACALFILVNSLAGITGQIIKMDSASTLALLPPYWLLLMAVLTGGQMGSGLGATRIKPAVIKKMTALLILYVAARLIIKSLGML